ncbi:Cytochrome c heme lyase subunit CcmL [hydrothermal vent metagenome]|uniref:Cytochrome c heme lyase subunit CcmL n=1 Tax=hydrothermal vent metagenome TaxID=652676 RepID=A0A3B1AZX6_9ZZZZ
MMDTISKTLMTGFVFISISFALSTVSFAGIEYAKFDDPKKEQVYKRLINELRCLVCQNQTIAGSNAGLAKDLRKISYDMIQEGKSYDDVVAFMTKRYGDFVMYRPPFKLRTVFLWVGPAIFLILGLWLMLRYVRSRNSSNQQELTADDHKRAASLLDDDK